MERKWPSTNVYLNKYLIKKISYFNKSFFIQSPWNEIEGIWFPIKMTQNKSMNKKYFSVSIYYDKYYAIYRYKEFEVCEVKEVRGETLIEGYEELKRKNSSNFLQSTKESKNDNVEELLNSVDKDDDIVKEEKKTKLKIKKIWATTCWPGRCELCDELPKVKNELCPCGRCHRDKKNIKN